MPELSCIITSFNNRKYIADAIDSVLRQTHLPDELVIADDASTDGSVDIIHDYALRDSRIRLIEQERNCGVSVNRNHAINEARGEFVTTLDGDDIYYPEKIRKELMIMRASPDSVAFSDVNMIDSGARVLQALSHNHLGEMTKSDLVKYLLYRQGPIPRDMMFPKELFIKAGGFHSFMDIYEDWDLKMRMANLASDWRYSDYTGIGYRQHEGGLSSCSMLKHYRYQVQAILNNSEWVAELLGPEHVPQSILSCSARALGYKNFKAQR